MKAYREIERKYYKYGNTISIPQYTSQAEAEAGKNGIKITSGSYLWQVFGNTTTTTKYKWNKEGDRIAVIDFGTTCELLTYNFRGQGASNQAYNVDLYPIEGSNDGIKWYTIDANKRQTSYSGTFTSGIRFRYIRVTFHHTYSDSGNSTYGCWLQYFNMSVKQVLDSTSEDYDYYIDISTYKLPKTIERKYWKDSSEVKTWTQPQIKSNGTWGVTNMSVKTNSGTAWYWVWHSGGSWDAGLTHTNSGWVKWYTTDPICVTKLTMSLNMATGKGTYLQGSNDDINWVNLSTAGQLKSSAISIPNNTQYFKYHRLMQGGANISSEGTYTHITDIKITANYIVESIIPGTPEDYDFYTDTPIYYGINT